MNLELLLEKEEENFSIPIHNSFLEYEEDIPLDIYVFKREQRRKKLTN